MAIEFTRSQISDLIGNACTEYHVRLRKGEEKTAAMVHTIAAMIEEIEAEFTNCPCCGGSGGAHPMVCPRCGGSGEVSFTW